nr:hypothetical protein [bacterium]
MAVLTCVDEITFVHHSLAVYHHWNVYPVLFGVGNSPYVASYVTSFVKYATSQLFASKVTTYFSALHCA